MGPMGAVPEKMTGPHKYHHRVVDLLSDDGSTETVKSADAKERFWGVWSVPQHLETLRPAYDSCPAF
ncbi:MAG TPA: hypothetical protein VI792_09705 [Candidatus Eisenbacteria bacterium]